jgi:hypothetical protein
VFCLFGGCVRRSLSLCCLRQACYGSLVETGRLLGCLVGSLGCCGQIVDSLFVQLDRLRGLFPADGSVLLADACVKDGNPPTKFVFLLFVDNVGDLVKGIKSRLDVRRSTLAEGDVRFLVLGGHAET